MLDPAYLHAVIDATESVFETMMQLRPTAGPSRIMPNDPVTADATALIGLSGGLSGAIAIRASRETAQNLVNLFAGAYVEFDQPDFADALGELANMVAGKAKIKFPCRLIEISTPSVVTGMGHTVRRLSGVPAIEIPFESDAGPFTIDLMIAPAPQAQALTPAAG